MFEQDNFLSNSDIVRKELTDRNSAIFVGIFLVLSFWNERTVHNDDLVCRSDCTTD